MLTQSFRGFVFCGFLWGCFLFFLFLIAYLEVLFSVQLDLDMPLAHINQENVLSLHQLSLKCFLIV